MHLLKAVSSLCSSSSTIYSMYGTTSSAKPQNAKGSDEYHMEASSLLYRGHAFDLVLPTVILYSSSYSYIGRLYSSQITSSFENAAKKTCEQEQKWLPTAGSGCVNFRAAKAVTNGRKTEFGIHRPPIALHNLASADSRADHSTGWLGPCPGLFTNDLALRLL